MNKKPSIAIVGAGIGGLTVATTLRQIGLDVHVYEQAPAFARVGAGIQMLPNAMKVLRWIGIEERLRSIAFAPKSHLNLRGDTGEVIVENPMSETRYGAPYFCLHRADLHEALVSQLPSSKIHLNKRLIGIDQRSEKVALTFADGTRVEADAVIGADGVHSIVRQTLVGPDEPRFTGRVAYRGVFPSRLLNGYDLSQSRKKWWGEDRHIVIYYIRKDCSETYFVTSLPEDASWLTPESWSAKGDIAELRAAYSSFHPEVQRVLSASPDCHKWAILDRDPLPSWSDGNVVLLGDSCHPMTPYMAQGAGTTIEDAAVLARCISEMDGEDLHAAFRLYEAHRKPRTTRIQEISRANSWMRQGKEDTDWLYGYDATTVPLADATSEFEIKV